jgi:hypothetical protein
MRTTLTKPNIPITRRHTNSGVTAVLNFLQSVGMEIAMTPNENRMSDGRTTTLRRLFHNS